MNDAAREARFGRRLLQASLVFLGVTTFFAVRATTRPAVAHGPREWTLTPVELQATRGLGQRAQLVREEIARIASGDESTTRRLYGLAQAIQQLDQDEQELLREAAKARSLDVGLVQSGTVWTERK
jgi:hypothetical protein